ncbi:hypothetical protein P691DRAFT_371618 [Macrolepiota fuliginosa MF-IS2]|uniref:Uncharacterized protein n=1 Tax=Macrolepiota fuliginosa MF-IS2 TaxID=1400762 RepID=A0A9P6BZV1_9AGAR|nr:hypothetical protein P691DRAFT_371618 [Macrolepiota fuliginosa MF-IS2]
MGVPTWLAWENGKMGNLVHLIVLAGFAFFSFYCDHVVVSAINWCISRPETKATDGRVRARTSFSQVAALQHNVCHLVQEVMSDISVGCAQKFSNIYRLLPQVCGRIPSLPPPSSTLVVMDTTSTDLGEYSIDPGSIQQY